MNNPPHTNQDVLIDPQTPIQNPRNQSDCYPQPQPHPVQSNPNFHHQPQPRRPRGFAATAAAAAAAQSDPTNSVSTANVSGKAKREREKEKERTKLRERHRRAITSRMLAGLRQFGNFSLPARADMNDVLAALAREAGWTVEADGTTYRQSPPSLMASFAVRSVESPVSTSSLKNCSGNAAAALECRPSVLRIDESLSPASLDSVVMTERDSRSEKFAGASPVTSVDCLDADQLIQDVRSGEQESNYTGSSYVPVYVMLATGFVNNFCQLVDPHGLRQELSQFKSLNVDGVIVECWWGIVEAWNSQKYLWSGYREVFNIIREFKLKLQVVMAFHEYGRSDSGEALISLPHWVLEIGKENPDIFFTDREGRRNTECLSWGTDKERVLKGRTGVEVYFDFMRSFRKEFDDLFTDNIISAIEIGLGAAGELKYPSFPERMGWRYPGVGEFQCYDKYLQQSLRKAAKLRGHSFWARGPDNAGHYNSRPHETRFFCERGDYDSYYGRFFLHWYAQTLIEHADNVLSLASLAFDDVKIIVKVPAVYWWYRSASHAAELTAGFHNPTNHDGYSPVFEALKKHLVTIKFVCSGLQVSGHELDQALTDPEGLSWQVLNSAWDRGLTVAGVNVLSCYDREGCMRVAEMAKPRDDPDNHQFAFFVYQQPTPLVQGTICFTELEYFIKLMHGDASHELMS